MLSCLQGSSDEGRVLVFTGNSQLCRLPEEYASWGLTRDAKWRTRQSCDMLCRSWTQVLFSCTQCLQVFMFSNNQSLLRNILWLSPSTYNQLSSEVNNLWIFPRASPVYQEASIAPDPSLCYHWTHFLGKWTWKPIKLFFYPSYSRAETDINRCWLV